MSKIIDFLKYKDRKATLGNKIYLIGIEIYDDKRPFSEQCLGYTVVAMPASLFLNQLMPFLSTVGGEYIHEKYPYTISISNMGFLNENEEEKPVAMVNKLSDFDNFIEEYVKNIFKEERNG